MKNNLLQRWGGGQKRVVVVWRNGGCLAEISEKKGQKNYIKNI
jgi:hypothetical protein